MEKWTKIQKALDISSGAAIGLLFWLTVTMGIYGFVTEKPLQESWLMFYGMVIGGKTIHGVSRVMRDTPPFASTEETT